MALALSAAACSTRSDKPVIRTEIAMPVLTEDMRRACAGPVAIPKGRLSEKDVVTLWGTDRRELKTCGARLGAVLGAVK